MNSADEEENGDENQRGGERRNEGGAHDSTVPARAPSPKNESCWRLRSDVLKNLTFDDDEISTRSLEDDERWSAY